MPNPPNTNLATSGSIRVYQFFSDEVKRTSRDYESPERQDKDSWKLLHYCHQVRLLARRRMVSESDNSNPLGTEGYAASCHELLDTLLETIGVHAQEKELVLEHLSLRLQSGKNARIKVAATIQDRDHQQLIQTKEPVLLSQSSLQGIVTEHLNDAVVIRFNVEGESEEREFFWADLNATSEELPVGSRVKGETRLLRVADDPTDNECREEMKRIHQSVEAALKARGLDPDAVIGGIPDEKLRQESARIWADDQTAIL